jgi:hypothetical protein
MCCLNKAASTEITHDEPQLLSLKGILLPFQATIGFFAPYLSELSSISIEIPTLHGVVFHDSIRTAGGHPRFVIDDSGVREYSDAPLLVRASERNNKTPVVATATQPGSIASCK